MFMSPEFDVFVRFATAVAIGFLIGVQREIALVHKDRSIIAGERTTSLLSLGGAIAAMLADLYHFPSILIAFLAAVTLFVGIGYFAESWQRGRIGVTSEMAILISVMIGVLCYQGELGLAVALGIATTVILSIKVQTDQFVKALSRKELYAALQLAVISAIVLPVLPDRGLAGPPLDVLNPFNIWLMVVFISAINFLGYVFARLVGQQGIELSGFIGGLVSSTAVTLGFSERSKRQPNLSQSLAVAIIISWTVMFARMLVLVWIIHRGLFNKAWLPLVISGVAGLIYSGFMILQRRSDEKGDIKLKNPLDLAAAIRFGVLFTVVLLISSAAQYYFGDVGVLVSSAISGLANVSAITLTVAELSRDGVIGLEVATQSLLFAVVTNLVSKGLVVILGGDKMLRRAILPGLILMLVTAIVMVIFF
ncbi:MAG: MgtC/SapB family protein [Anaerolineales bacterium]|nr:MgtC/SapB family protein [Anaerolineales bacterium]